jgi:hypothetical protein
MPIYEYYCPDNHTIYQFYAKSLAQGQTMPKCPDNPKFRLRKVVSAFAITGRREESAEKKPEAEAGSPEDARLDAAMGEMEREFSTLDENDPKAMARMMRRMSELTGEKIEGQFEEVVRKLEEGADPDSLEEHLGAEEGGDDPYGGGMGTDSDMPQGEADAKEPRHRFRVRRGAPRRDPKLYDYE